MVALGFLCLGLLSFAAAKGTKGAGQYNITLNGNLFSSSNFKLDKQSCVGTVQVRGLNNGFDIECSSLNLYNFTLTGAPADGRMVTSPTQLYTSREMVLTPTQLGTPSITSLEMKDGTLVALFAAAAGKVKFQAGDNPQGGLLQMETEFSFNVTHVETLAPGIFFFLDPNLNNSVRFGNGIDADSTHAILVGKDSPQGADRLYQDGSVSKWNVWSGGRMGAVMGEDALEVAPGAGSCTAQCQIADQVRGSLPVTTLPDSIVPL